MTRWLLLAACLSLLAFPACVLAGNPQPQLYLEVYQFAEEPIPVPDYVCSHASKAFCSSVPCFAPRAPYNMYYMPLHICKLVNVCPLPQGPQCADYGGYVGCGFGVQQTNPEGTPGLLFQSWNACPGFLRGPSAAGEPAACLSASTIGCRDWFDHEGYLLWLNLSNNSTRKCLFNIVPSADLGHYKVINCANLYDEATVIAGSAEIDDAQSILCSVMPVESTTWGRVKGLFK